MEDKSGRQREAGRDQLVLDLNEITVRELNNRLRELEDGTNVTIENPRGQHSICVGQLGRLNVTVNGHAGYFLGGLCDGPDITVNGSAGVAVAENLMSGTVRVNGNASSNGGASAHGGTLIIDGNASSRTGISLKGGTIAIAGDIGHMSAFMAQAGTILVGGDAGYALGDSLYEAVIYVQGKIDSFGADAREEDMTAGDVEKVRELVELTGFDHIDPENVKRVASAKTLYHFDALKGQEY